MKIKFKKLVKHAMAPVQSTKGAACYDLFATDYRYDIDNMMHEYGTGIAIEIEKNHVGLLFPRSSISKTSLTLANSAGVIDSDYRGEITFRFREIDVREMFYIAGDRIGQILIIPYPDIEFEEVDKLSNTTRGAGGWGSTGE